MHCSTVLFCFNNNHSLADSTLQTISFNISVFLYRRFFRIFAQKTATFLQNFLCQFLIGSRQNPIQPARKEHHTFSVYRKSPFQCKCITAKRQSIYKIEPFLCYLYSCPICQFTSLLRKCPASYRCNIFMLINNFYIAFTAMLYFIRLPFPVQTFPLHVHHFEVIFLYRHIKNCLSLSHHP